MQQSSCYRLLGDTDSSPAEPYGEVHASAITFQRADGWDLMTHVALAMLRPLRSPDAVPSSLPPPPAGSPVLSRSTACVLRVRPFSPGLSLPRQPPVFLRGLERLAFPFRNCAHISQVPHQSSRL